MDKIKIGICGYGNLGKGVEKEISKVNDIELKAIFTRRNPKEIQKNSNVEILQNNRISDFKNWQKVKTGIYDPLYQEWYYCK